MNLRVTTRATKIKYQGAARPWINAQINPTEGVMILLSILLLRGKKWVI